MHDIKWIRDNAGAFDAGLGRRGLAPASPALFALDAGRREALAAAQAIQAERKEISRLIGQRKAKGDDAADLLERVGESKQAQADAEERARLAEAELDAALAALPIGEAELGLPATWRIGPALRPPSDESYVAASFTPAGVGLRPFSVVHVEQPWRTAREPGDLAIRWTRRSRSLAADGWDGVPLAEESDVYEVEILDGPSVVRTLESTAPRVTYAAGEQIADFGTLLGPGDTLDLRIVQLSALVGRGTPAFATLQF
jgi:hypothetical protein